MEELLKQVLEALELSAPLPGHEAKWSAAINTIYAHIPLGVMASHPVPVLTAREVELLRELRVNLPNVNQLNADWRNDARNLLLRIEQAAAGVQASAPSVTDEELTRRFTRCAYPGPNPMYRCNACGAEEFGVRNLLVAHAAACGVKEDQRG